MATATKPRQATRKAVRQATQVKTVQGEFVAQRQEGGAWVTVIDEEYANEHHRANLLRAYSEWVNNATGGEVRRAVEHCTVDGKPRHIIRAESVQGTPDGESEFPDHDAEALRQFLADATGLKWRVGFDQYNYQGVDYAAPSLQ